MMSEQEYRDMYNMTCMETAASPTERGFEEYKSWRSKLEALFDDSFEKDKDYDGGNKDKY